MGLDAWGAITFLFLARTHSASSFTIRSFLLVVAYTRTLSLFEDEPCFLSDGVHNPKWTAAQVTQTHNSPALRSDLRLVSRSSLNRTCMETQRNMVEETTGTGLAPTHVWLRATDRGHASLIGTEEQKDHAFRFVEFQVPFYCCFTKPNEFKRRNKNQTRLPSDFIASSSSLTYGVTTHHIFMFLWVQWILPALTDAWLLKLARNSTCFFGVRAWAEAEFTPKTGNIRSN